MLFENKEYVLLLALGKQVQEPALVCPGLMEIGVCRLRPLVKGSCPPNRQCPSSWPPTTLQRNSVPYALLTPASNLLLAPPQKYYYYHAHKHQATKDKNRTPCMPLTLGLELRHLHVPARSQLCLSVSGPFRESAIEASAQVEREITVRLSLITVICELRDGITQFHSSPRAQLLFFPTEPRFQEQT